MKMALYFINGCGVVVRTVTYDGLRTNQSCCKLLGASLQDTDFCSWFFHPSHSEERVLFPNPAHALKLVRNTLGDYTIIDAKKRLITFRDIEEL